MRLKLRFSPRRKLLLRLAVCLCSFNMMTMMIYKYVEKVGTIQEEKRIVNIIHTKDTQDKARTKRSENLIFFERWPRLDTTNVRNRHLPFNPKQHPLEADLVKLTEAIIDGKNVRNEQINPHDFKYLHKGSNICETKELFLILIVKSKVDNFESRQVIRETWGDTRNYQGVRIVFILGHKKELEERVKSEANEFKDIVQEDFVDDYSNNTLKTIMGFRWVSKFCSAAKFNLYVDDDVFVVVQNLNNFRKYDGKKHKLMMGQCLTKAIPYRDNGSKWFIPWEEFPFDRYPPYLNGAGILTSWDVTRSFSVAFPYVKPVRIDDAYLGIVAKKLGIIVRPHHGMVILNPGKSQKTAKPMNFKRVVVYHRIPSPESMIETWKAYCKTTNACVRSVY